jgi:exonuclease SbcC
MIHSILITNFQSHKETELIFSPGVNIILGQSDSGKTAIFRALCWPTWNRPVGDEFRSDWGGETKIELRLDESRIIRSKDKENIYQIDDNEPLKAFGKDVPVEISKILNIDETNIQQQLDSPFLLTESPGEVAKHFNHIAHLEQIDKSLSFLNAGIKRINRQSPTTPRPKNA